MIRREKGMVLPAVIAFVIIFTIVGFAILTIAEQEIIQTRIEADKTRAFYYAEAGLAKLSESLERPVIVNLPDSIEGSIEQGNFRVNIDSNTSASYVISTGISGVVQKKVRTRLNFLAAPFEDAVFAMNTSGSQWAFQLRGTGNPVASGSGEKGGKDIIRGNMSVDGDVFLFEQSSVNSAPSPNVWGLHGDIDATGGVSVLGSASVSGTITPNGEDPPPVDIRAMDYAHNNTDNVAQTFTDAHVTSGHLPSGNPLRDIFVKNPSDRASECSSTSGDDYFLEPSSGFVAGTEKTGATPLNVGNNRVYYVDGDVWVHSQQTYGFNLDGKVTIVATGNIHICDNIQYKDSDSILGLVALGKYDSSGNRISGGDIFFGDPRFGTMYVVSGMMFAANDFLYNSDAVTRKSAEPTTGFTINGSFGAMNQVLVERDWYSPAGSGSTGKPARYDTANGKWVDSGTGTALTSTQISTLRHYQMIINYDDRVRTQATRPPGLPQGPGRIFSGFSNWEEL